MIHPFFRRKEIIALLLSFLIVSAAGIDKQVNPVYAAKKKEQQVEKQSTPLQQVSKDQLLELVSSLKQTIEQLDSRLTNIENKLEAVSEEKVIEQPSELVTKWVAFSSGKKDQPQEQVVQPQKAAAEVKPTEVKAKSDTTEITFNVKEEIKEPAQKFEKDNKLVALSEETKIGDKADKVFVISKDADKNIKLEEKQLASNHLEKKADKEKIDNKQQEVSRPKESSELPVKKFRYNITVQKEDQGNYEVGSILIGGKKVIAYRSDAAGYNPFERAEIVAKKIENLLANGADVRNLRPAVQNGHYIGSINGDVLFTVDSQTAQRSGLGMQNLTVSWVNNIRNALGVPDVERTASMYPSRGLSGAGRSVVESETGAITRSFDRTKQPVQELSSTSAIIEMLIPMKPVKHSASTSTGRHQSGMASWYGPYFHGRRAADGSRFNMNAMTAAHKTLPFGTLVKVTNLNNNRECVVRITDRGPFIHGRVIDLSKAAAQQIGMLGSGVARVKVEVIGTTPRNFGR